jgi:hypothetical protein
MLEEAGRFYGPCLSGLDRHPLHIGRPAPRAEIWSALTDPVRLHDWMGAAYVEPRVGGRYELMLDGPNPMIAKSLAITTP